ncbi:MAG TPA: MFS transporter [Candidatus Binataceae bacterium]|nr:MFS transporter [Candidatus Binataceae bacterium]
MTSRERRPWIIVAAVFVTLFLMWGGGVNTGPVFIAPLLKYFGWSRARVSTIGAAGALMGGACGPFVGWLVDRFEARKVMVAGALTAAAGFLVASRADSYGALLAANLVVAIGVTAATLIPSSIVIAGWFDQRRRGLAMGMTFAGTSLGGAAMIVVANKAIAFGGWRAGYITVALPMLVIVAPLVLFVVRSRPADGATSVNDGSASVELPGVDLGEAFRTRSFWLIGIAEFCWACAIAGILVHLVVYLIGAGYTASLSASCLSLVYLTATGGKLLIGPSADRVSPRLVLSLVFMGAVLGTMFLLRASVGPMLVGSILLLGIAAGTPLVLFPLIFIQSLGVKRLGSVQGVAGIFATVGGAVGPVLAGRIFDLSASYAPAFSVFAAMWLAGGLAIYFCIPLEQEMARLRSRTSIQLDAGVNPTTS